MLLLFDVDGTLVRVGGAGRRALARAFELITGVAGALDDVRLDGSTDLAIIRDAFSGKVGRPARDQDEIARIVDAYLAFLDEELDRTGANLLILPGAVELTRAACAAGHCAVGLATGNVELGAKKKLARAKLDDAFAFGGYGSDSERRAELVQRAIERGSKHAESKLGRTFAAHEALVIGDTELDVLAARACGAVAVGVLAGSAKRDALIAAKPDLLIETLEDDRLWSMIGLERRR